MREVNDTGELRFRRARWLALVLALLVTLPSVRLGLFFDDQGHKLFLQQHLAHGGPGFLDLFDICGRSGPDDIALRVQGGALPWWTSPTLSIAFFRPLAVLTQYLDYVLWPNTPALMHAQNVLWYALLVLAVAALYRRMLGATTIAGVALLFYAIDEAHADGVAWVAGRNTLMTALFVVLTVLAYDHARRERSRAAMAWSCVALACACASGEGGIAAWAYLVAYALFLDRAAWRERLAWLAPLAAVTLSWQLAYRALGYGVHGSGFYRDPFVEPWKFLSERLPDVGPVLLREQLTIPGIASVALPALRSFALYHACTAISFALLLVVVACIVRGHKRRELGFWLVAFVLALMPPSAAGAHPRLLFVPGVAAFAICAELLGSLVAMTRDLGASVVQRAAAGLAAGAIVLVHGPLALALCPFAIQQLSDADAIVRASVGDLPHGPEARDVRVFMLDTPNYFGTLLAPLYRDPHEPPIELHVLCANGSAVKVIRSTPTTLVLEPTGGFLREPTSWLVRRPEERFVIGQQIATSRFTAVVERLTGDGRPSRVRFEIPDLEAPHNVFMRWHARYERVRLPAVGRSMWLLP